MKWSKIELMGDMENYICSMDGMSEELKSIVDCVNKESAKLFTQEQHDAIMKMIAAAKEFIKATDECYAAVIIDEERESKVAHLHYEIAKLYSDFSKFCDVYDDIICTYPSLNNECSSLLMAIETLENMMIVPGVNYIMARINRIERTLTIMKFRYIKFTEHVKEVIDNETK